MAEVSFNPNVFAPPGSEAVVGPLVPPAAPGASPDLRSDQVVTAFVEPREVTPDGGASPQEAEQFERQAAEAALAAFSDNGEIRLRFDEGTRRVILEYVDPEGEVLRTIPADEGGIAPQLATLGGGTPASGVDTSGRLTVENA